MVPEPDSVRRFTDRVSDYARSRPGYPAAIVSIAQDYFELPPRAAIADIGAGTGKLSIEFLRAGHEVFAVEPNVAMRRAAAAELSMWQTFHVLEGTAEASSLDEQSVHLVTVGQAFHWFDQRAARREFERILRPGGGVMLLWNNRRTESSRFLQEYDKMLLDHCPDYVNVGNKHYEETELAEFFAAPFRSACLRSQQFLDAAAFEARLFSSSYTPASGAQRQALEAASRALFREHARSGRVCIDYDTEIFYGRLHRQPA